MMFYYHQIVFYVIFGNKFDQIKIMLKVLILHFSLFHINIKQGLLVTQEHVLCIKVKGKKSYSCWI